MTHTFHSTALELYLEVLPSLKEAARQIRVHDKDLARQLDRSAKSVSANLAEADTPCPGNSRSRIETAYGSLRETRTHLRVAAIYDYMESSLQERIDAQLDRVSAMTWKRSQARRRRR